MALACTVGKFQLRYRDNYTKGEYDEVRFSSLQAMQRALKQAFADPKSRRSLQRRGYVVLGAYRTTQRNYRLYWSKMDTDEYLPNGIEIPTQA